MNPLLADTLRSGHPLDDEGMEDNLRYAQENLRLAQIERLAGNAKLARELEHDALMLIDAWEEYTAPDFVNPYVPVRS